MSRPIATALTAAVVTVVLLTGTASGGSSPPGKQPPVDVTPPSINGNAQVKSLLTATPGTWTGKSLRYAYQWLRCGSTGASCLAITGASAQTYSVSTTDSGATVRVIVTASNRNGSAAATSGPTAVVTAPVSPPAPTPAPSATSPSNTSLPVISGTAQQGQQLAASAGSWSGTPTTYTYNWQRCDSGGLSCASVSGATGTSYVLGSADVGSTMRVSVTASNSVGSATASSAATTVVTATSTATSTPSAPLLDLSATKMTCLWKTTISDYGQCPAGFWDDLGFTNNDVQLVSNSTYGQVYRHRTGPGSGNGYYHCPSTCAASYLGHYHAPDLGTTVWYSDTIKVESPYTCTDWGLVWQLNYGQSSPPMGLALNCGQNSTDGQLHFGVYRNAGAVSCIGCQPSSANQQFTQLNTGGPFLDKWVDFVVGIHWSQNANDSTGWYEVYTRTRGNGETGFTLRDARYNILTMQFCTCGVPSQLSDKQDQYFGYWDSSRIPSSGFPTNYVDHTGLTRSSDKAAGIASRG
jgi:Polysaccharide lyase